MKDGDVISQLDALTRRALVLAIARYASMNSAAADRARDWLDEDELPLLGLSDGQLREAATAGLDALAQLETRARDDTSLGEAVRVGAAHARLAFQSARSGSFKTANGALSDFLRQAGEEPDALDIH